MILLNPTNPIHVTNPHPISLSLIRPPILLFPQRNPPPLSLSLPSPLVRRARAADSLGNSDGSLERGTFEAEEETVGSGDLAADGPVYQKTLRLVETAMFAAVTGLAYFLSNSLAVEVATAMLLLTLSGPIKASTYLVRAMGAIGYVLLSSFLIRENILSLLNE
ncbi:hypothetical protein QJS04_geneDACA006781 [Acorus gramineus]|uniref:Uncharacterized protein n=1 Tax=Acorus gramineus TaxID=55184 RepID=A0AAV9AWT2_ACOGR|nr:hypothetical protein QJS04_geneDACA006781 [Acorus gramineus]